MTKNGNEEKKTADKEVPKKEAPKEEEEKNKGGRPPIWEDPIELKELVFDYFNENNEPTLAGLAEAIGIARSTLYEYEKKDRFSDIIKKARRKVEAIYEHRLVYGKQPTGVIFSLKNMGWTDKTETDVTSKGKRLKVGVINYDSVKNDK
jgi:DNA-binding XRE family transcriptional regulator